MLPSTENAAKSWVSSKKRKKGAWVTMHNDDDDQAVGG